MISYRKRTFCLAACILCCVLWLAGCGQETGGEILYNSTEGYVAETAKYLCYRIHDQSSGTSMLVCEDRETGEIFQLKRDFADVALNGSESGIFCRDDKLYYIRQTPYREAKTFEDDSGTSALAILEVDMETLSERTILERNLSNHDTYFLGLRKSSSLPDGFSVSFIQSFFIHGNSIYIVQDTEIWRMNLVTGAVTAFLDLAQINTNVAYDGEQIYYLDEEEQICIMDLGTGKTRTVPGIWAKNFLLAEDGIYYSNRKDNDTVWYYDEGTGAVKKLGEASAATLGCDGLYVYYWDMQNNNLYRADKETGSEELVMENGFGFIVFPESDHFYTESYGASGETLFWRVDTDTLEAEVADLKVEY